MSVIAPIYGRDLQRTCNGLASDLLRCCLQPLFPIIPTAKLQRYFHSTKKSCKKADFCITISFTTDYLLAGTLTDEEEKARGGW